MLLALLVGALTGVVLAIPIGPLNATIFTRTMKSGWKHGLALGIGAAVMDIIYCGCAAQINQFLMESPIINLIFQSIGCLILLWLGIRQFRAKPLQKSSERRKAQEASAGDRVAAVAMERMHIGAVSLFSPFILGVALYATNVFAVPEWVVIAGIWRGWGALGTGVDINAAFAAGAGIGTALWYVLLVRWIASHNREFQPGTLKKIDTGMAILMLFFAGYFAFQIAFKTHWAEVKSHAEQNTNEMLKQ